MSTHTIAGNSRVRPRYPVQNIVRGAIFVLVYTLFFLVAFGLLPKTFSPILAIALFATLPIIGFFPAVADAFKSQIFDGISLHRDGVELFGGWGSESWLRPYNEFRVELRSFRIVGRTLYRVKLKHRVLPNLLLIETFDESQAEQLIAELTSRSPLKRLKD